MFVKIIIAIVALILLVIVIRMLPLIKIMFHRIFFGRYSARYIEAFKRFTNKSPYSYCIKDDFVNSIAGFYQKRDSLPVYHTQLEIGFAGVDFGSTFRQVLKMKGRPVCVNAQRLQDFDLKIFGYRDTLFSSPARIYFYFINGRFFMGEYSLKDADTGKTGEVAHILFKKYLNQTRAAVDDFLIIGPEDIRIRFGHTGFSLSMKYLWGSDEQVSDILGSFWANTVKHHIESPSSFEEELLNKL